MLPRHSTPCTAVALPPQPNGEEGQLQEVEGTLSFSNPGFDMDRSPLPKGFHTTEDGMLEDF